jgi:hypothetical protein
LNKNDKLYITKNKFWQYITLSTEIKTSIKQLRFSNKKPRLSRSCKPNYIIASSPKGKRKRKDLDMTK